MRVLASIALVLLVGVLILAVTMSHNAPCGVAAALPAGAQPMQAVAYRCYGPPNVVKLERVAKPAVSDGHVLVRVHAASVNPLDWHYVSGEPYVVRAQLGMGSPRDVRLGVDFAGTVEAVRRGVTRFKPGDRVFGGADGSFGEFVAAREMGSIALMPANSSFEQAAAVPVAGVTALQAVRDYGKVRPGEKVVINGAGGGVGTFAVQIAKALGAEVTAVTNTGNLDLVRSLGADHVIDYTREDFARGAGRYDLIIDCGGGHSLFAYGRVLTPRGRVVWVGEEHMGRWIEPVYDLFIKPALISRIEGRQFISFVATLSAANLATLRELIESGKVKPVIDRRYPLSDTSEAIRYLETGHARGKVVIDVSADASPAGATAAGAAGAAPPSTHTRAEASDITIDGAAVYPESVTASDTGTVYVGSLGGTIYRAAPDSGTAEPWIVRSDQNGLLSIFGVLADERSGTLWVCTAPAALPGGIAHGQSALLRFDLHTGAFRQRYPLLSARSICDDIAIARDGTAFVADIGTGEILTLAPGAETLRLFTRSSELEGIDGIAFGSDGALYVDNVRRSELLRVARTRDGRFERLVRLHTSVPIGGPDGFRHVTGNRFVLADSRLGRIDEVTIRGDEASIRVLRSGLDSPSGVAFAGGRVYAVEGKIEYLFDPKLRGRSPAPFTVRVVQLP